MLFTTKFIYLHKFFTAMDEKAIENAGLTRVEAKIYLALIDLGSAMSGAISRKTGIHRRSVYDAIERLIEKGLVSYIEQNNRKYFEPVSPQRLLNIVTEKENSLKEILPELIKKYNTKQEKKETTFFRGKMGIKSVFEDQLKTGKEILILGATLNHEKIIKYYFPHFDKRRTEKKIKLKMLFYEGARDKVKRYKLCKTRFLPSEYESHTTIYIYNNKVTIVLWAENPLAILISQKEIADGYIKYFNLLWKIAKE